MCMTSRSKILLGCLSMVLAMAGDYLLGYGTISTSSDPDAYLGISWNQAPDWRYALSSLLGFACAALFAVAALELLRVLRVRYQLKGRLFQLFQLGNWSGILYFAFIHIGICMLPVVFNAGMDATGDLTLAVDMTLRVLRSIALPLILGFVLCDLCVTIGWVGLILQGRLPLKKLAALCNPIVIMLVGQLANLLAEGLDSGFESLGWLLLYLVSALTLVKKGERVGERA